MSEKETEQYKKILFKLERDAEGYPPNDWEMLWAYETENGLYFIDNVPFYVRDLSWGDVVSVEELNGELHFKEVMRRSQNSVIRVIVYDHLDVQPLRAALEGLRCETEQSHVPSLISVDISPSVSFDEVTTFLDSGESGGKWQYETASIRHP